MLTDDELEAKRFPLALFEGVTEHGVDEWRDPAASIDGVRGFLSVRTSRGEQVHFNDLYPWERRRFRGVHHRYPPYPRT